MESNVEVPQQERPTPPTLDNELLIIRICAGIIVAGEVFTLYKYGGAGIYLLPLALGALVPLLNMPRVTSTVEEWEAIFGKRRDVALGKTGNFAKFVSRPLWSGSIVIFNIPGKVPLELIRAGLRLTLLAYYFGIFFAIAFFVAYISIAIVIGIAILALVLWVAFMVLSHGSTTQDDTPNSRLGGFIRNGTSRKNDGFFGMDPHVDHFDESGRKVGESRTKDGFFGMDPHVEHTDADGHVTGESRERDGFFGMDPHVEHTDTEGHSAGESRERDGFFGLDPHVEHTDVEGNSVGESRAKDGFLGLDPHIEHKN